MMRGSDQVAFYPACRKHTAYYLLYTWYHIRAWFLPPSFQSAACNLVKSNDRLLVPLVSFLKRNRYRVDAALVVPVEDTKPTYEMDGVLALASKGGDVCRRFEHFCRENLCMESWYFVVDAVLYEMVSPPYYLVSVETTHSSTVSEGCTVFGFFVALSAAFHDTSRQRP